MRLSIALVAITLACSSEPASTRLPPAGPARIEALGGPQEFAPVFIRLDSDLSDSQRDTLQKTLPDSSGLYHMSLGLWLRNEVIHGNGPLNAYMEAQGVRERDDMSDVLLQAYGAYLRGTPIDVPRIVGRIPPPPTGFKRVPAPRQ